MTHDHAIMLSSASMKEPVSSVFAFQAGEAQNVKKVGIKFNNNDGRSLEGAIFLYHYLYHHSFV